MNDQVISEPATPRISLPDDFVFSQSSLQTYVDCKRKFWLTYLNRVPWPSTPASPANEFEQVMRLGATFHRMVQRAEEGISTGSSTSGSSTVGLEYPLQSWFHAYLEHRPADLPSTHIEVERTLETPIQTQEDTRRLLAKYDLIAADDDRTVIMDWKTGSKLTRPAILQQKMQTSIYPYVLVEASAALPWGPVRPEQVEMRYWFVVAPDQHVSFPYDSAQHASTHQMIRSTVSEILASDRKSEFPKVADTEFTRKYVCGFCTYRGYCDRGVRASDLADLDESIPDNLADTGQLLDFSLDDVDEIPF